jgi:predicted RNA-binding protein with PUA domain
MRIASLQQRRSFEIRAEWDGKARVWWCSNNELPLTTEAPTFEKLVSCVLEIAPEIAAENGLSASGDEIEVHVIAECAQSAPVVAAV